MRAATMAKRKVRKLFSTGQAAELIGVDQKTIANYVDRGYIKGIKLPGLGERRIPRQELRKFLVEYDHVWPLRELDMEEGIVSPEVAAMNAAEAEARKAGRSKAKLKAPKKF